MNYEQLDRGTKRIELPRRIVERMFTEQMQIYQSTFPNVDFATISPDKIQGVAVAYRYSPDAQNAVRDQEETLIPLFDEALTEMLSIYTTIAPSLRAGEMTPGEAVDKLRWAGDGYGDKQGISVGEIVRELVLILIPYTKLDTMAIDEAMSIVAQAYFSGDYRVLSERYSKGGIDEDGFDLKQCSFTQLQEAKKPLTNLDVSKRWAYYVPEPNKQRMVINLTSLAKLITVQGATPVFDLFFRVRNKLKDKTSDPSWESFKGMVNVDHFIRHEFAHFFSMNLRREPTTTHTTS